MFQREIVAPLPAINIANIAKYRLCHLHQSLPQRASGFSETTPAPAHKVPAMVNDPILFCDADSVYVVDVFPDLQALRIVLQRLIITA
jgi:hypothetical protein